MRLFIGIQLPQTLKTSLSTYQKVIESGTTVAKENYHITLVYLGETTETKKETVHRALKTVTQSLSPCTITLTDINTFKKGKSHIVYVDVAKSPELMTIQTRISSLMQSLEFTVDTRAYNPHITLARKVKEPPQIHPVSETVTLDTITLFLSHRVNDTLTYTPIETYRLEHETIM